jgi:hypothetical protein
MIRRLDAGWRRRARQALFGPTPVARRVILTPFAAIVDTAAPTTQSDGWWHRADIDEHTLVQVPQGSACTDAVLCLEDGTEVTFVGACGALAGHEAASADTILEATTAVAFDGTAGQRTWPGPLTAPPVAVATVRCLADSSTRHDELRCTAAVADLETAWILSAGQLARCPTRALLAVTDNNVDGAVFDTDFPTVVTQLRRATDLALTS